MHTTVLLVNYDSSLRQKIHQSLGALGYQVIETEDAESGLATLQASKDSMVVLFNVTLHENTLTGTDGFAFLGAAACGGQLARRHAFIILTPTPNLLEAALGRLLNRLSIPILAEPVDIDEVCRVVGEAERHLYVGV
jgi:DNA-binding NtrC family response regulator